MSRRLEDRAVTTSDTVSGTVLVWALRPEAESPVGGDDAGPRRLGPGHPPGAAGARRVPGRPAARGRWRRDARLREPQVLQAAACAGVTRPLICFSGHAAGAGALLLERLISTGVPVRYHGDFDWPGCRSRRG
ncbi:DUF2399 domain-containing protein [Terrabacter sp. BE26]|uniref:DUF2399 domain-containing protein n=1 Tax=Terrabacter sp. BE26 TaxID=2898152 RepID=UPI0035BE6638